MKTSMLLVGLLLLGPAACAGGSGGGDVTPDPDGRIILDNDAIGGDGVLPDGVDAVAPPVDILNPDAAPELVEEIVPDVPCVPDCQGPDGPKACGGDGCGGLCGTCNFGDSCVDGVCITPVNCGDGKCVEGESCLDCAVDCGKCPVCGDEACNGEETCLDCAGDCGECCGDGACTADHSEDCFTCEADCGVCCGDDACVAENGEDCTTCTEDCGLCCGDGACTVDHEEDCFTCAVDCGACCGDAACVVAHGEACDTCPDDCGACPACGDGECNGVETCGSCLEDCPCGGDQTCFEDACCLPDCGDAVCGSDGCGSETSCGVCLPGTGCAADGTCVTAGDATCLEIYECRVACPAGDTDCIKGCDEAGTVEAQEAYTAWVDCLEVEGYFDCAEDDDPCYEDAFAACEELVDACLQGEDSCGEVFDCKMACPGGDTTCALLCELNGTLVDQDLLGQLYDCVSEQCPDGTTLECWFQATAGACAVLADICWSEPCETLCGVVDCGYGGCNDNCGTCGVGTICSPDQLCVESQGFDCLDIYECRVACPAGDSACLQFCNEQGTDEAQEQYNAWGICLQDAGYFDCPDGDTECTSVAFESCLSVIKACLHGELTCGEIFDCQQLDCPSGDSTCVSTCYWNGTIAMQDSYELMMDCFDAACPGGLTYTCIEEALLGDCAPWATTCWKGCEDGCAAGTHCLYGGCGQWCDVTCPDGASCDVGSGLCL
ncbi:MAG: hypothetical protein ABIK09_17545 [Pseudomonadota bacterium]